jgi:hypothetical protein
LGVVPLNLHAQRFPWSEQVLLSDELLKRARAHAIRERPGTVELFFAGKGRKEAHRFQAQGCRRELPA